GQRYKDPRQALADGKAPDLAVVPLVGPGEADEVVIRSVSEQPLRRRGRHSMLALAQEIQLQQVRWAAQDLALLGPVRLPSVAARPLVARAEDLHDGHDPTPLLRRSDLDKTFLDLVRFPRQLPGRVTRHRGRPVPGVPLRPAGSLWLQ